MSGCLIFFSLAYLYLKIFLQCAHYCLCNKILFQFKLRFKPTLWLVPLLPSVRSLISLWKNTLILVWATVWSTLLEPIYIYIYIKIIFLAEKQPNGKEKKTKPTIFLLTCNLQPWFTCNLFYKVTIVVFSLFSESYDFILD